MHPFTVKFADFCKDHFDLTQNNLSKFQSLSICLIDCIYSLRTKYVSVTQPIIERYADRYMNGNIYAPNDTLSDLLARIDEIGLSEFADKVLQNHQELGGKAHIRKEAALYQLAKYLKCLHIDTMQDFRNFECPELLEIVIRSVKGMGDAGTNYLFMLAGDPNRCKPDVHIHHCIKDACGKDIPNEECQILFQETVALLQNDYPGLTVQGLDGVIWNTYQSKQNI